eukprot:2419792-Amphidinium_carterae.1
MLRILTLQDQSRPSQKKRQIKQYLVLVWTCLTGMFEFTKHYSDERIPRVCISKAHNAKHGMVENTAVEDEEE